MATPIEIENSEIEIHCSQFQSFLFLQPENYRVIPSITPSPTFGPWMQCHVRTAPPDVTAGPPILRFTVPPGTRWTPQDEPEPEDVTGHRPERAEHRSSARFDVPFNPSTDSADFSRRRGWTERGQAFISDTLWRLYQSAESSWVH